MKTGEILPPQCPDILKQFDSIYLGAIGHPDVKPGILEKGIFITPPFRIRSIHQPPACKTLSRRMDSN